MSIFIAQSCSHLKYLNKFEGFKSNPKKVEITNYRFKKDLSAKLIEKEGTTVILNFDKKGKLVSRTSIGVDGFSKHLGWQFEYGKKGNLNRKVLLGLDSTIMNETHYSYENGKLKVKKVTTSNKTTITTYKYDIFGNVVNEIGKNVDGSFEHNSDMKYDKKGNMIEIKPYDKSGNIKNLISISYDDSNQDYKTVWDYGVRNFKMLYYKKIDKHGNQKYVQKSKIMDGDTTVVSVTETNFKYDDRQNCIYQKSYGDGEPFSSQQIKLTYWE